MPLLRLLIHKAQNGSELAEVILYILAILFIGPIMKGLFAILGIGW